MRLVSVSKKAFAESSTNSLYRDPPGRGFLLRAGNLKKYFINMDGHMKDLLNPSQWNSLRITLRTFEENLRRTQEWLDGKDEHGTLYQYRLVLSAENRKRAQRDIKIALDQIAELSRLFEMPKENENSASLIRGQMSVSWADLHDSRTYKLGRYGKVHPELAKVLDSKVQHLAEIALNLAAIFGESEKEK